MPERNVAIVIFYDDKENIIFQERGSASRVGEKYGFWGGEIEPGETPEQAIKRELKEELGFVPKKLDYWGDCSFVIKGSKNPKYNGWLIKQYIFLSPITSGLEKIKTYEGEGMVKMTIDEAIKSKGFSIGGTEILKKFKKEFYEESQ